MNEPAYLTVLIAMLGGAIRVSTPFMFVSLGECLTEKSGRVNLGLEGTLVLGAMVAYAGSYHTGNPWIGVFAAGVAGSLLGAMHGSICGLPRVNDVAVGIAMMLFGVGVAFFFGKPYIQPEAPRLASIPLGFWSGSPSLKSALQVNPLFFIGIALALVMAWALRNTRWGLVVRTVGDSAAAARAMGISVNFVRLMTTTVGGFAAGVGGAFLSLSYPGSWNQGLSSGQGLMAVALVIFARWDPLRCIAAALLFGAAGAIGPSLQSIGVTQGYYFFNAAPYILTLGIMIATSSAKHRPATCRANCRSPSDRKGRSDGEGRGARNAQRASTMSGLGGLNKSPNGVVIGVVQLKLPVVVTSEDLAAQTETIVAMVGKARRNMGTMDLVVFPEYSLHGLSMDMNPAILCSLDGPEVAAFKQACRLNRIWGCFSLMEFNPNGNPYNSGLIIDDAGDLRLYYRKMHPWTPVEPWEPGDIGVPVCDGPRGVKLALIICHDGMFPEMARECAYKGAEIMIRTAGYTAPIRDAWRFTNQANSFQNLMATANVCMCGSDGKSTRWARG